LLQPTADLTHLLDPVRLALREVALHELQVVDDQQVEPPLLGLESTGLGPQLQDGEDRRVVDPHRRGVHLVHHLGDLAPVGLVDESALQGAAG